VRHELISRRAAGELALRGRLNLAQSQGDLPASLARYIVTLIQGMSVQAAGGASRKNLQHVIENALQSWPSPVQTDRKQLGTHVPAGD
jgi:hypothetical protein